jgi:PEP-CTERM motif
LFVNVRAQGFFGRGGLMKRWLLWPVLMVVLVSPSVFANSVTYTITRATFTIFPNTGFGENIEFQLAGNGISLTGIAGSLCDVCNAFKGLSPGAVVEASADLFFDNVLSAKIGHNSYGFDEVGLFPSALLSGTFTLPTNGKNFTVVLPASISDITGTIFATQETFTLAIVPGSLRMHFDYNSPDGLYYLSKGTFTTVPEPGTLALVGTGLAAIVSLVRRKLGG